MISPDDDKNRTKGQGCREFDNLSLAQGRSWFDFFVHSEIEELEIKNRYEIRLRNDRAYHAIQWYKARHPLAKIRLSKNRFLIKNQ